jgi:threonine synthase
VPKVFGDFLILRALRESHGAGIAVSEQEIVQGQDVAACEGLFMVPRGRGAPPRQAGSRVTFFDDTVVLFDTGTAYKYLETTLATGLW